MPKPLYRNAWKKGPASSPELARAFFEQVLWSGKPKCGYCGSLNVSKCKDTELKKGYFRCRDCDKRFTVCTGTIMARTHLTLDIWLKAILILKAERFGCPSTSLSRHLGIMQKTAWLLLHKIRKAMEENDPLTMTGTVEVDETYIGGKFKNFKKSIYIPKVIKTKADGTYEKHFNKMFVMGCFERGTGRVIMQCVKALDGETMEGFVSRFIAPNSTLYTDTAKGYSNLISNYAHDSVNHKKHEYKRGDVSTNGIESVWNNLKGRYRRCIWWSRKHIHRYLHQAMFAYNHARESTDDRVATEFLIRNFPGRQLTYNQLVA